MITSVQDYMHMFMVNLMYEYESERIDSFVYDFNLLVLHWTNDVIGDELSVYESRMKNGKYK